jgi:hypothetical protein
LKTRSVSRSEASVVGVELVRVMVTEPLEKAKSAVALNGDPDGVLII